MTLPGSTLSGKRALNGPSALQTFINYVRFQSDFSSPLAQSKFLIAIRQKVVSSRITRLLFTGSPSAIIWRIIAVIVNAINRGPIRPWPHVSNKRREADSPSVAHLYPSTAVVFPVLFGLVSTSRDDPAPNAIFRAMTHAVRLIARQEYFSFQASTTTRYAALKVVNGNDQSFSALTFAQHKLLLAFVSLIPDNRKSGVNWQCDLR